MIFIQRQRQSDEVYCKCDLYLKFNSKTCKDRETEFNTRWNALHRKENELRRREKMKEDLRQEREQLDLEKSQFKSMSDKVNNIHSAALVYFVISVSTSFLLRESKTNWQSCSRI